MVQNTNIYYIYKTKEWAEPTSAHPVDPTVIQSLQNIRVRMDRSKQMNQKEINNVK